jgi:hypothetical protein
MLDYQVDGRFSARTFGCSVGFLSQNTIEIRFDISCAFGRGPAIANDGEKYNEVEHRNGGIVYQELA